MTHADADAVLIGAFLMRAIDESRLDLNCFDEEDASA